MVTLKIFCMKGFCSRVIISCTKFSMAMKPLGDRSVLDERFRRKLCTVSPMFIVFMVCNRSFLSLAALPAF